jgi:putative tryptophan/tyrosine transport system substrate-binding protein
LRGSAAQQLWPLTARAQRPVMPVVGFLSAGSGDMTILLEPFRQGLKESGFVEGQNVKIEYRWAEGKYERLPTMAAVSSIVG